MTSKDGDGKMVERNSNGEVIYFLAALLAAGFLADGFLAAGFLAATFLAFS